jgi:hypothetical protein
MSQRHYFLSTTILSSDCKTLDQAVHEKRATVVEVAEANYQVPMPWLACFRPDDLRPCTVEWEKSMVIMVPCVDLLTAVKNLHKSLPLFERLTGENKYARDYWNHAVYQMLSLQLPFVTLDISEMLMNIEPQELNAAMRSALGQTGDALDVMQKTFFNYHPGVLPYERGEFYENRNLTDKQRITNTVAIDAAICAPSPGSFRGEQRWGLL